MSLWSFCPRTAWHVCVLAAMTVTFASHASAQTADLVVLNGRVFTADTRSSLVEGFAIKDGRFIAAGSSAAMRAHVGPGTNVVDLGGRFVAPGLADGHLHGVSGGPGIDLAETRSLDELFAVVGRAAKDAQPGAVIISNSDWHEAQLKEKRLPTARELDQYAPVNPVVLVRGGHEYVLNSAALAKWGITKQTPVAGGRRDRQRRRRRAQRRACRQRTHPGDAACRSVRPRSTMCSPPSARSTPTASPARA